MASAQHELEPGRTQVHGNLQGIILGLDPGISHGGAMHKAQLNESVRHRRPSPQIASIRPDGTSLPAGSSPAFCTRQQSWVSPPQRQHRWPSAVWCFIKHLKDATIAHNTLHTGSYITAFSITTQLHRMVAHSPPESCPSVATR